MSREQTSSPISINQPLEKLQTIVFHHMTSFVRVCLMFQAASYQSDICRFIAMILMPLDIVVNWQVLSINLHQVRLLLNPQPSLCRKKPSDKSQTFKPANSDLLDSMVKKCSWKVTKQTALYKSTGCWDG